MIAESPTSLEVKRIFYAPREKVFRAWTQPDALKKWWGPTGASTPVVEIDLRVGGEYRFGIQFPDEDIFYISGVYLEVKSPEKLVFTWQCDRPDMDFGQSQVTVEFHPRHSGTEVILRHDGFPTEALRRQHEIGWRDFFNKFAQLLEGKEV